MVKAIDRRPHLSGNTSRYDDNFNSLESLVQLVCGIALDLYA
jgi:hypothetical protein